MRLIDADELKKKAIYVDDYVLDDGDEYALKMVNVIDIELAPTIDAAPIVHAKWVEESGTIVCSHCKHKRNTADREYTMYCGHCGAKMGEDK